MCNSRFFGCTSQTEGEKIREEKSAKQTFIDKYKLSQKLAWLASCSQKLPKSGKKKP